MHWKLHMSLSLLSTLLLVRPYLLQISSVSISPLFSASGTTALGEALSLTANRIDAEVQKTTAETKGDWRPLVFLMTDGGPTDDWRKGLNEFKAAKKVLL